MERRIPASVFALSATALLACESSAPSETSAGTTSSSSASSSSGSGGSGPIACGASQGVTAQGTMTPPSFDLPATQSCAVSAVKTSPDLSVDVGCDDGMGGTATLTMTIQATPPVATSLKVGDKVFYNYASLGGPGEIGASLLDASKTAVLGFVNASSLIGIGSPTGGYPFFATDVACTDDAARHALAFDWGKGQATIADGDRGTIGDQGAYVAQIEKAAEDASTKMPHYTLVIARQP
jgi:hypothetical protein